jgi:hypothetical protein
MEECQHLCLFYNCDEQYFKGHKCKEYKLFQMDVSPHNFLEEIPIEDTPEPTLEDTTRPMEDESTLQVPCDQPQISLHALLGFSTSQSLKLIGYIKHRKVIVLIDSGNTHNLIHRRVAQETHCYVRPIFKVQIMIANGGMMKCGG